MGHPGDQAGVSFYDLEAPFFVETVDGTTPKQPPGMSRTQ